jgi:hypothetical protein
LVLADARGAYSFALRAALPFARMLASKQRTAEATLLLRRICTRLRRAGPAIELAEARVMLSDLRRQQARLPIFLGDQPQVQRAQQ